MAIEEYRQKISFIPDLGTGLELDERYIDANLSKLSRDRRVLARLQIDSLEKRMDYQPRLREVYIQEIYKLIQFELKKAKKKDIGE